MKGAGVNQLAMITYEQDDDVLRWSFNPFHDPYANSAMYCGQNVQHDAGFYNGCYAREDLPYHQNADEEHLRLQMCPTGWYDPPRNYYPGYGQGQEEVDDTEPSSSCSSPGLNHHGEDLTLELVDDSFEIDGEVGKRLNRMVPIPHVPRINGEIPSIDEATTDHQRLIDRLRLYDLVELKVLGDGNCQFRALSDQFYRSPEHHKFVRQQVITQLVSQRDIYEGYVLMEYSDYIEKVSQDGEWGDHVTLQAAADTYGVKIFVITSFKDTCYIEILPNTQKSNRVIFLSFWAEVHYNSIYPEGDLPTSETKKKKRWWRFRSKN